MKTNLLAFFVIAAFALSGYAQADKPAQAEKRFVSKEHHFSVVLPSGYDDLEVTTGPIRVNEENTSYSYMKTTRRGSLSVYVMHPNDGYFEKTAQIFLHGPLSNFIPKHYVVSNSKDLTIDGHPARSLDLRDDHLPRTTYTRAIYVSAKPYIYTLRFVTGDQAEFSKPDVKKFFSSFRIEK